MHSSITSYARTVTLILFLFILQCNNTNFSGGDDLESLLSTLIRTFVEFKNHEMIENTLIMKKLKHKLKKLSIRNSAVCNCHKVRLQRFL